MKKFDGCLLVSDVDGTLIYPGGIPESNIKAIKYFMENGGRFTLATGRCCDAVRELIKKVPINAPVLAVNGVVVYDFGNERVVHSTVIEQKDREILTSVWDEAPEGIGMELHSRDKVVDLLITHEVDIHNKYEDLHPVNWSREEILSSEWNKIFFTFENIEDREVLKNKLCDKGISPNQLLYTNAYLDDGVHDYLEIVPLGADKGTGVRALAKELGIDNKNIFGIGDYYNDMPLLKAVGCAGVVAGAPKEILSLADFVSCSALEGAVGRFIEYIEERMLTK